MDSAERAHNSTNKPSFICHGRDACLGETNKSTERMYSSCGFNLRIYGIMKKKQKEKSEMDKLEALVNSLEKLLPRGKDEKIVKKWRLSDGNVGNRH